MRLRHLTLIGIFLLATGCTDTQASDPLGPESNTPSPVATSETEPSETSPTKPKAHVKLKARPGAVGAATAGMTVAEAAATGLFDTDATTGSDACPGVAPLQWKDVFADNLDVLVADGRIASIGILTDVVKTENGVGVGSTLGEVNEAYGDQVSPAVKAGYGQMGVFVNEGDGWLGFLVDDSYSDVSPASMVTFMEVTAGQKPELKRDDC